MSPISISVSRLVIGETSTSWKVSVIFIGSFTHGKLATRVGDKKYHLVRKDLVKSCEVCGKNRNGYPLFYDLYLDKNTSPLYHQDWSKKETWQVI